MTAASIVLRGYSGRSKRRGRGLGRRGRVANALGCDVSAWKRDALAVLQISAHDCLAGGAGKTGIGPDPLRCAKPMFKAIRPVVAAGSCRFSAVVFRTSFVLSENRTRTLCGKLTCFVMALR